MISLNAFSLLKTIGAAERAFAAVETDIEKAALAIAIKAVKKAGRLEQIGAICAAVGAGALGVVIDTMKESEVTGLNKKLDKHWADVKTAGAGAQREHVLGLASGRIAAAEKPAPAPKPPKPGKAKKAEEPEAGWSSAMSVPAPASASST
jgi:hypothetical protein